MSGKIEIPVEVRELADRLGVDVDDILKNYVPSIMQTPGVAQSSTAQAEAVSAVSGAVASDIPADVADGVDVRTAETSEQRMQRELAVAQQELQQTRKMMQTMSEGRVVGSAGLSGPVVETPPNLGGVEPGLRWAVRNGLIEVERIADPLIRDLFKNDQGGVI